MNNVAELLVQLTNTKLITQNQNTEEKSQVMHDFDHRAAPFGKISFYLGPVVQSIVSLMSWLRGQLVKCFTTL